MTLGHKKMTFLNTPTPLERLDHLSQELGRDIWLKRDDLTNFGTGGNKLRKLEYFVQDALDQGATMLLTVGGAQTNHGRLTAAVAAKYGLKSAIVAVDEYPGELSANLLLDGIMDCHVYLVKPDPSAEENPLKKAVASVTAEWEEKGEVVYYIPMGGSNELGSLGYYDCALEIAAQCQEQKITNPHLVATVGSMGTFNGLMTGISNEELDMKLSGVLIMPYKDAKGYLMDYYAKTCDYLDIPQRLRAEDINLREEYTWGAYNNPVKEVREAIYYMGKKEGILLDPCYTGKTFYGLLDMIKKGAFAEDESIILLHTGGIPGLYTKHHRLEMEAELKDHIHII